MHLLKIAQVPSLVVVGVNLFLGASSYSAGRLSCVCLPTREWGCDLCPSALLQHARCVPQPIKALEIEPWFCRSAAMSKLLISWLYVPLENGGQNYSLIWVSMCQKVNGFLPYSVHFFPLIGISKQSPLTKRMFYTAVSSLCPCPLSLLYLF